MIIAATGHRPNRLGGFTIEVQAGLGMLALAHLTKIKPAAVISGMALGWDTAVAEAALMLGLPLTCAVPFKGQEEKWPPEQQTMYRAILSKAREVETVNPGGFEFWKMHARNKWMVDRADHMLAIWDGSKGGTCRCIEYADRKNVPITNLWDEWSKR